MDVIEIARVAHEVNRAYRVALGDVGTPMWKHAPEWQRASTIDGVQFLLEHPDTTPEQSHERWLQRKLADGWRLGPVQDVSRKEHPCCLPHAQLPAEQRAKDYIFGAVVRALSELP